MNRRDFLKTVGAASASAMVPASSFAQETQIPASELDLLGKVRRIADYIVAEQDNPAVAVNEAYGKTSFRSIELEKEGMRYGIRIALDDDTIEYVDLFLSLPPYHRANVLFVDGIASRVSSGTISNEIVKMLPSSVRSLNTDEDVNLNHFYTSDCGKIQGNHKLFHAVYEHSLDTFLEEFDLN